MILERYHGCGGGDGAGDGVVVGGVFSDGAVGVSGAAGVFSGGAGQNFALPCSSG